MIFKPKELVLLISMFTLSLSSVHAAPPGWNVNPADYNYSMAIVGAISIDKEESLDSNDKVAAFIDGECRGVVELSYESDVDRYIAYLLVYSNYIGNEISFKVYDASEDQVLDIPKKEVFASNGLIGDLNRPYLWANIPLNDEAQINDFNMPEQEGNTLIEGKDIFLKVVYGTDFSALEAEFSLSEGATAWVKHIAQESGKTSNDFSIPLTYRVRSEDEQVFVDYTITVTEATAKPSDIEIEKKRMDENLAPNTEVTTFSTVDLDDTHHTYALVSGDGDTDNGKFKISGNKLLTKSTFDYEERTHYSFRLKASDDDDNSIEKSFTIKLNDLNDNPPFAKDTKVEVKETLTVNSLIHTIVATDADSVGGLFFSVISGNESGTFKLDSASGEIRLAQDLDYESVTQYLLEIELNDSVNTSLVYIKVNVQDINDEIPVLEVDSLVEISEFWAVGELLTSLKATDADANTTFSFDIISGNSLGWVSIDKTNGKIKLAKEVEYIPGENTDVLEVSVSDGVHSVSAPIQLEVNDKNSKPVLKDTIFYVDENIEAETFIGDLLTDDPDKHQFNTYYFLDGDTSAFLLSPEGVLSVKEDDVLDYETQSTYTFQIEVLDNGSPIMGDTANIIVEVNDLIEDILPAVNTITPNGDGVNDLWKVDNVEIYQGYDLYIFNARGDVVYESSNYQNDWNGSFQGHPLPPGVYYYLFQNQDKHFKGTITLIK